MMSIWFLNWLPLSGPNVTAAQRFPVELTSSVMDVVSGVLRMTYEQLST